MRLGPGGEMLGGGGELFASKAVSGGLVLNLGQVGEWTGRFATAVGADTCISCLLLNEEGEGVVLTCTLVLLLYCRLQVVLKAV